MSLSTSNIFDSKQVKLRNQNIESTQGTPHWCSLEISPIDRVKCWDFVIKIATKFPSSLPPIEKHIVPPLCLAPPLCLHVKFKSEATLGCH